MVDDNGTDKHHDVDIDDDDDITALLAAIQSDDSDDESNVKSKSDEQPCTSALPMGGRCISLNDAFEMLNENDNVPRPNDSAVDDFNESFPSSQGFDTSDLIIDEKPTEANQDRRDFYGAIVDNNSAILAAVSESNDSHNDVNHHMDNASSDLLTNEMAELELRLGALKNELARRNGAPGTSVIASTPVPVPVTTIDTQMPNIIEHKKSNVFQRFRKSVDSHGGVKKLADCPIDFAESTDAQNSDDPRLYKSNVHSGDTDSSEDEQERDPFNENTTYLSAEARALKKRVAHAPTMSPAQVIELRERAKKRTKQESVRSGAQFHRHGTSSQSDNASSSNVAEDYEPFFRIRIMKPKMSSVTFGHLINGKSKIRLGSIRSKLDFPTISNGDWLTMAVIIEKFPMKTTSKGTTFSQWRLSDLSGGTNEIKLFLFGECHQTHWKLSVGTVIALLCPSLMESNNDFKSDAICIKIDHHQKLLEIGNAKDMAFCKAKRNDKKPCTNVINREMTDYCDFHVMKASKKIVARRGELQRGGNNAPSRLTEKIFGKSSIMTVSGQPGKNSNYLGQHKITLSQVKTLRNDGQKRANSELEQSKSRIREAIIKNSSAGHHSLDGNHLENPLQPEVEPDPLIDMMRLTTAGSKNLIRHLKSSEGVIEPKPTLERSASYKFNDFKSSQAKVPCLGKNMKRHDSNSIVSLDTKIKLVTLSKSDSASGSVPKPPQRKEMTNNKNVSVSLKDQSKRKKAAALLKRKADSTVTVVTSDVENQSFERKRPKFGEIDLSDPDVLANIRAPSKLEYLADQESQKREGEYFRLMESKEKSEKRMNDIKEIANCTVVTCKECDYTWHKRSDFCKQQNHDVKWHTANKRFFKCSDCSYRVQCFSRYPTESCSKCGSSQYLRSTMKEERTVMVSEKLQIRGAESPFVGS